MLNSEAEEAKLSNRIQNQDFQFQDNTNTCVWNHNINTIPNNSSPLKAVNHLLSHYSKKVNLHVLCRHKWWNPLDKPSQKSHSKIQKSTIIHVIPYEAFFSENTILEVLLFTENSFVYELINYIVSFNLLKSLCIKQFLDIMVYNIEYSDCSLPSFISFVYVPCFTYNVLMYALPYDYN